MNDDSIFIFYMKLRVISMNIKQLQLIAHFRVVWIGIGPPDDDKSCDVTRKRCFDFPKM